MNVITKSVQLPDGRTITIETGKVAKQADGAAVLRRVTQCFSQLFVQQRMQFRVQISCLCK